MKRTLYLVLALATKQTSMGSLFRNIAIMLQVRATVSESIQSFHVDSSCCDFQIEIVLPRTLRTLEERFFPRL